MVTIKARQLSQSQITSECLQRQQCYTAGLAGLSEESQSILADIQNPQGSESYDHNNTTDTAADALEYILGTLSQEDEDFAHVVWEVMGSQSHICRDHRTWQKRVKHVHANWTPFYPLLMLAFLKFHYPSEYSSSPLVDPTPSMYNFSLDSINIYMLESSINVPRAEDIASPVEALVLAGYLSPTPIFPTIAISISTLKLYHLLHLHKPSFSIKAYAKLICDLYKLQDEPELKYLCMLAFDGNNSLSQMTVAAGCQVGDQHIFHSDYFLDKDYVNLFTHEVTSRDTEDPDHDSGNNADASTPLWTQAVLKIGRQQLPMQRRRVGVYLKKPGYLLVLVVRGIIQWIVDMIQSGELSVIYTPYQT
ncbi:hypothetical protein SCLCIDRAFT_31812 [Scleroderma citrinum Foug A]|uniref:CxC1-like cysteine cluster associated with KDZ transposases domain-containing protein n=1 Tax=Scleroderma citrinum Foug A TaxID=1036808 RepID=A0A0C3DAY4_9AGAM|nr:hypothetical protein SCLCIDRAFT_31812 [Scleroderma citrinum Foug A]